MNKLSKCSSLFLILWILTPLEIMVLNAKQVDVHFTYNYWIGFLFLAGIAGWVFGIIYLIMSIRQSKNTLKDKLISLLPLFSILLFGIWCVVSAVHAGEHGLMLIGLMTARDTLFVYFCYAGLILSGIATAYDKKATAWTARLFLFVTTVQAIITLINNDFTKLVSDNSYSTCAEYESIFYNTNHYGYYLAISIIVAAFMALYSKNIFEKIASTISFAILLTMLAFNNTMGSLVAVAITLILITVFIATKKVGKKSIVWILVLIVAIGAVLFYFKDSAIVNIDSLINDIKTVFSQDEEKINHVGSGRGILWETAVQIIKENPIFGKGPQNVMFSAHNAYLQIAMYTGIPGIVLYLLIFAVSAIVLIRQRKSLGQIQIAAIFTSICYMISAFFGLTVFYTAPYFYIVLGFALSGALIDKEASVCQD